MRIIGSALLIQVDRQKTAHPSAWLFRGNDRVPPTPVNAPYFTYRLGFDIPAVRLHLHRHRKTKHPPNRRPDLWYAVNNYDVSLKDYQDQLSWFNAKNSDVYLDRFILEAGSVFNVGKAGPQPPRLCRGWQYEKSVLDYITNNKNLKGGGWQFEYVWAGLQPLSASKQENPEPLRFSQEKVMEQVRM